MNDQRNGGFLAYFDSVNKIAVALGAVVALIAGIVALVYQLWPNPGPPPPPRNATMTITDSFRARFIDFLLETGQDIAGYSNAELEQLGNEYSVMVTVNGLRNKNPEIVWNLRGDIGDLSISERKQWFHQFLASFEPPADSFIRTAKVWIQYPPFEGRFFAEIAIEYPEFETLVTLRTKPFAGKTTQRREPSQAPPVTRTTTTVMTIPASVTSAVTTVEGTTTVATTIDGTTTTSTVPTFSTVTNTTTIPARTTTITRTVAVRPAAGAVPIVRPNAKLELP